MTDVLLGVARFFGEATPKQILGRSAFISLSVFLFLFVFVNGFSYPVLAFSAALVWFFVWLFISTVCHIFLKPNEARL